MAALAFVVLISLLILAILGNILLIGKHREVKTPEEAIKDVSFILLLVALAFVAYLG